MFSILNTLQSVWLGVDAVRLSLERDNGGDVSSSSLRAFVCALSSLLAPQSFSLVEILDPRLSIVMLTESGNDMEMTLLSPDCCC